MREKKMENWVIDTLELFAVVNPNIQYKYLNTINKNDNFRIFDSLCILLNGDGIKKWVRVIRIAVCKISVKN